MSLRLAYVIVLLGAMLWGTTGTVQSFMPQTIHPLTVGAMRLVVGGGTLLLTAVVMRKLNFSNWPWRATIIAAIAMAIFQPFFFISVRMTGIAIGTAVAIGSAPIFSGLISWIATRQLPNRVWFVATFTAIVGGTLLFVNQEGVIIHPAGILFALGAGFFFAIYAAVNKEILAKVETIPAVAVIFSISAMLLLPLLFLFETEGLGTVKGVSGALFIGILGTGVAYILFSEGLKYIPPASAVTLSLSEPLTAAILSVIIVGEVLSRSAWFGVGLLLSGILILTFGGRESKTNYELNENNHFEQS